MLGGKRSAWFGWGLLAGLLLAPQARAAGDERGPYLHMLGAASVGRSLRFNNPFRLEEPLGKGPESVSLAAGYSDFAMALLFGLPWGAQHGVWVHGSIALTGIPQEVLAPSYVFLWRFERGRMLYGRAGAAVVIEPDANVGFDAGVGGVYLFSGSLGVTAELGGSAYYGAATREVAATLVPLLSLQAGLVFDWESLP